MYILSKMSFKVISDFLSPEDLKVLRTQLPSEGNLPIKWYDRKHLCIYQNVINKFIEVATSEGYDFSKYEGYENWFHDSTKYGQHVDKDEVLFEEENKYSFPICSIIYYTTVENLKGGELVVENEDTITPKDNKLVIFGPNILHDVRDFTGIRKVFLVNFWKTKPKAFK